MVRKTQALNGKTIPWLYDWNTVETTLNPHNKIIAWIIPYLYVYFTHDLQDLAKMKIGNAHRNKIWKSLLELRNQGFTTVGVDSQELTKSLSSASTVSMTSQNSISQNSTYNPGFYEVTRYTFKHTISLTTEEKHLSETSSPIKVAKKSP